MQEKVKYFCTIFKVIKTYSFLEYIYMFAPLTLFFFKKCPEYFKFVKKLAFGCAKILYCDTMYLYFVQKFIFGCDKI